MAIKEKPDGSEWRNEMACYDIKKWGDSVSEAGMAFRVRNVKKKNPHMRRTEPFEPWCGKCGIGFYGETYCMCGATFEERRSSNWEIDGNYAARRGK